MGGVIHFLDTLYVPWLICDGTPNKTAVMSREKLEVSMIAYKVMDVIETIASVFEDAAGCDGRGRTGGCLTAIGKGESHPVIFPIGVVPDMDDQIKYWNNSKEKAVRSVANPKDISCWITRNADPKVNKYGGGIRALDDNIYAFSGLSEHWDEAVSVVVANIVNPGSMTIEHVREIAKISKNPHIVSFFLRW